VAPTAKHLVSLKHSIETNKVTALFTEPGHSAKLARQFAADLKLRVASLDTLETGAVKPASYEQGMKRNLRSIQDALQ
jgi:ABC-type Zn uptake system ZnuABC Zn-binding protein ZnuA